MIDIKAIASGSHGNGYLLSDSKTKIIIEAGVSAERFHQNGVKISDASGLLVSHEHSDHSKYIADFIKRGIELYTSQGTFNACGLKGMPHHTIKALHWFTLGSFEILPFDVIHDAVEPLGFYIHSVADNENVLFFTDTAHVNYTFPNVHYLMAECNYCDDILNDAVLKRRIGKNEADRIRISHTGLNDLLNFIGELDKQYLREVWAMHLSDRHSNEVTVKKAIQELTGCPVHIC